MVCLCFAVSSGIGIVSMADYLVNDMTIRTGICRSIKYFGFGSVLVIK